MDEQILLCLSKLVSNQYKGLVLISFQGTPETP